MVRSPSCFNLYWGWLLIFLGYHESQVADPMIEARSNDGTQVQGVRLNHTLFCLEDEPCYCLVAALRYDVVRRR
jgi:hypothetical protein